jgi:hypothetical protein
MRLQRDPHEAFLCSAPPRIASMLEQMQTLHGVREAEMTARQMLFIAPARPSDEAIGREQARDGLLVCKALHVSRLSYPVAGAGGMNKGPLPVSQRLCRARRSLVRV